MEKVKDFQLSFPQPHLTDSLLPGEFPMAVTTRGSQPVKLKRLWKMLRLPRSLGRWAALFPCCSQKNGARTRPFFGGEAADRCPGAFCQGPLAELWLPGGSSAQSPLYLDSCEVDPGHRHLQWMDEWGRLWSKWWQKPCLPPKEDFSQDTDRWGEIPLLSSWSH